MLLRLLFLFIAVPLVELALLLWLAKQTTVGLTLALVIVTGFVGTLLARSQGFHTYQRIRRDLAAGQMPTDALLDAVLIFVAGALLLTPGILTDAFGMSLLLPPCRRFYRVRMVNWFKSRFTLESYQASPDRAAGAPRGRNGPSQVIDSYVVDTEDDKDGTP